MRLAELVKLATDPAQTRAPPGGHVCEEGESKQGVRLIYGRVYKFIWSALIAA